MTFAETLRYVWNKKARTAAVNIWALQWVQHNLDAIADMDGWTTTKLMSFDQSFEECSQGRSLILSEVVLEQCVLRQTCDGAPGSPRCFHSGSYAHAGWSFGEGRLFVLLWSVTARGRSHLITGIWCPNCGVILHQHRLDKWPTVHQDDRRTYDV